MKAGPKAAAKEAPLEWNSRAKGVDHFRLFCQRYLLVPKGKGAGKTFRPREWQLDTLASFFSGDALTNVLVMPRGNGKSGLVAAVCVHHLYTFGQGARVMVVAQDEASAKRLLATARRMIEMNEELAERAQIYKDRIYIPGTDSEMVAVASELSAVEGADLTLGVADEIGLMERPVWESLMLSTGKREGSKLLAMGTPSPADKLDRSPLWDLVVAARAGDPTVSLTEYGADDDCALDDEEQWAKANPALDDWLTREHVRAVMPPKTSESEFRRARLGQWVSQSSESYIPAKRWQEIAYPGVRIPEGTPIVVALDGSQRWDATAVVICSIGPVPHLELSGFWFGEHDPDYEVSHAEVEQHILDLATRYEVREVTADPFVWTRSLQVLEERGLRVTKFPQTAPRMPNALAEFRAAVADGKVTHSDDPRMNAHVLAAQLVETNRGMKLAKPAKRRHIDAVVAAVMAYSRAFWLSTKKKRRTRGYRQP